jgi:hypothetical protein
MIFVSSKCLVKILTLGFASAIALYPFVFVRNKALWKDRVLVNHEKIHLRQQIEMLILVFYLFYVVEFLIRLIRYRSRYEAYKNISFEREAFYHQTDLAYLRKRKFWAFLKFL